MTYLIMFDIGDDKRLRNIAKLLQSYGIRVQYSVFEVKCPKKQIKTLTRKINTLLKDNDRVHIFTLCSRDLNQRLADGLGKVMLIPDYVHIA